MGAGVEKLLIVGLYLFATVSFLYLGSAGVSNDLQRSDAVWLVISEQAGSSVWRESLGVIIENCGTEDSGLLNGKLHGFQGNPFDRPPLLWNVEGYPPVLSHRVSLFPTYCHLRNPVLS
ncbi:hypothetical protein F5146DRAFT_661655 [Armillaria mellea]|nr:hypothetical protein F5146DRAFT_661655 [Armillaria mellea]